MITPSPFLSPPPTLILQHASIVRSEELESERSERSDFTTNKPQISEEKSGSQHLIRDKMALSCKELVAIRDYSKRHLKLLAFDELSAIKVRLFNLLQGFSGSQRDTIINILLCSRRYNLKQCREGSCFKKVIYSCHSIYCTCNKCKQVRVSRAEDRLYALKVKSKRMYHFTIGSDELSKKELQKYITKYMRIMRYPSKKSGALAYKLNYIKVFDIGRGSYRKTKRYYLHFHIAIIGEKLPIKAFLARSKAVLKNIHPRLNLWGIGWRPTSSLLHYFACRMAGVLGEKKSGYYYYPNVMGLEEYFQTYYNRRVLTWSSPQGFLITTAPTHRIDCCLAHNEPYMSIGYEDIEVDNVPDPP